jgi:hypothetical protein
MSQRASYIGAIQADQTVESDHCKRRGRIYGGNQSVFTRCEILASNEMSGYEGCVKEEGEAVC